MAANCFLISTITLIVLLTSFRSNSQLPEKLITIECKKTPLHKVLKKLNGLIYFSFSTADLKDARPVTINAKNWPYRKLLDSIFFNQPVYYRYHNEAINIERKSLPEYITGTDTIGKRKLAGRVTDGEQKPVNAVTISLRRNNTTIKTKEDGSFIVALSVPNDEIIFSHKDYQDQHYRVRDGKLTGSDKNINIVNGVVYIRMIAKQTIMEPVTTMHELDKVTESTGNTAVIRASGYQTPGNEDVTKKISGKVPGLIEQNSNGSYGSTTSMEIRGRNTIGPQYGQGNYISQPQYIIDGIFMPAQGISVTQLPSSAGTPSFPDGVFRGVSLFRVLYPEIYDIQVAKDADATAIYGSRGGNGIMQLTTSKIDFTQKLTVNIYSGIESMPKSGQLLNVSDYINARKEASQNDKLAITSINSPDLDTNYGSTYRNYNKLFMGNAAKLLQARISMVHGTERSGYRANFSYYNQNSVLPGAIVNKQFYDRDISAHMTVQYHSKNKKFSSSFTTLFTTGKSGLPSTENPLQGRLFFPNSPNFTDNRGALIWYSGIANPASLFLTTNDISMKNWLGAFTLEYRFFKNFTVKFNAGKHSLIVYEYAAYPIASNPINTQTGSTDIASNVIRNFSGALTTSYKHAFNTLQTEFTGGATIISQYNKKEIASASGYPSDDMLGYISAASSVTHYKSQNRYKYAGLYARVYLKYRDRYIINLTTVKDASTLYGLDTRYQHFYTIAGAWFFSKEPFLSSSQIINSGKLRFSYGTTGNDLSGENINNDIWTPVNTPRNYGGVTGYSPTGLFNKNYSPAISKKMEIALECKLAHSWYLDISYYHHISNQVITQLTTSQTGFGSIRGVNSNAKVRNEGIEWSLQKSISGKKGLNWGVTLTGSLPSNQLLSFPGLEQSPYSSTLKEKQSLSVQQGFHYVGVNSQTGLYEITDKDKNGQYNNADYVVIGNTDTKFYMGIFIKLIYKKFTLNCNWLYRNQKGANQMLLYDPGKFIDKGYSNFPKELLNHWQKQGDIALYQKFSADPASDASKTLTLARNSSIRLVDASFLRLTRFSLSYDLLKSSKYIKILLYVFSENPLTVTGYKGADPATQSMNSIPTLRKYCAGIQVSLL